MSYSDFNFYLTLFPVIHQIQVHYNFPQINCNLTEPTAVLQTVNHDSLLNIVSHLHNNCLDQSKSSILEAQTLEEFILEKYPAFQFENGTAEPTTDEELYIAASLLLFFVCVNSKDADLKNAMCSRLSSCDQETILKYSKCLMECPEVTYKDVQSAILGKIYSHHIMVTAF